MLNDKQIKDIVWRSSNRAFDFSSLPEISKEMMIQDNRSTSYPIFVVRGTKMILGVDPRYNDAVERLWRLNGHDGPITSLMSQDALLRVIKQDFPEEYGYVSAAMAENINIIDGYWFDEGHGPSIEEIYALIYKKPVGMFFTERAAKDFLNQNGHNLVEPDIYVESAHNNPELILVMDLLVSDIYHDLEQTGDNKETLDDVRELGAAIENGDTVAIADLWLRIKPQVEQTKKSRMRS